MNIKHIPIATPIVIPTTSPRSNPEVELEIVSESWKSITDDLDSKLFLELKRKSDEIFVNFALSVIGSVVKFPPNNVECAKSV